MGLDIRLAGKQTLVRKLAPIVLAVIIGALGQTSARADQFKCDDVAATQGPDGYQRRGNRCEGLYEPYVSFATLRAYGFSCGPLGLALSGKNASLSFGTVQQDSELLVHSGDPAISYRMRTLVPANSARYSWPASLAMRNQVTSFEAFVHLQGAAASARPVYVNDCRSGDFHVAFFASAPIASATIKVKKGPSELWRADVQPDGQVVSAHFPRALAREPGIYRVLVVSPEASSAEIQFEGG
jgi:hypothetical protein